MIASNIFLIMGMALVTFAIRYPLLPLLKNRTLPPFLSSSLKFVPPAVLTALIIPTILDPTGEGMDIALTNAYLVAGVITMLVAWRSKSILLTLGIGMAAFWGLRLLLLWSHWQ